MVEVVPASAHDPRGAAFSASILPLFLIGIGTGALCWLIGGGVIRSLAFLAGASALAGLAVVAVIQGWLGVIEGGWALNAAAVALIVVAIAATAAGLLRLVGYAGLAITALVLVLLGNPWSGISSAPELLPAPLGAIGQLLPPGAGGDLLRGVAFFDGAGTAGAVAVLFVWTALGLVALAAGARRAEALKR